MNLYLVRAKPHNHDREGQFLGGTISIGWPVGQSLDGLNRQDVEELLIEKHDVSSITVTMVMNFLGIKEGDLVISPSMRTREIHVLAAIGGYKYVSEWDDDQIGNPHTIAVKHIVTVSREELSAALLNAIQAARKTVTPLPKYLEEVLNLVNSDRSVKVRIDDQSDMLLKAKNVLRALLSSEEEKIRLDAAIAILSLKW